MTPEQILAIKPKVLTQQQREAYFNDGFLFVPKAIGEEWIAKLRAATDELVERSRKVTQSDPVFDLEPAHTPEHPAIRRLKAPHRNHPFFDGLIRSDAILTTVAASSSLLAARRARHATKSRDRCLAICHWSGVSW